MRGCLSVELSKTTNAHLADRNKCGEIVVMRAGGVPEQGCGVPEQGCGVPAQGCGVTAQGPAERSTTKRCSAARRLALRSRLCTTAALENVAGGIGNLATRVAHVDRDHSQFFSRSQRFVS